ncbi:MAG: SulP family inorganic anion transporter [Chloroflexi bacterium]|nr:SulP family inorganic anion transporter [Chloroflexota bacterium]
MAGTTPGAERYVPALRWLPRYDAGQLRPDLIAALTVWALVVPQAIAYAQIAGLPPQHGLFAAAGGLLGYGLLGTSRQLIVTPTSSTAAISASLVAVLAMGDLARMASLSAALAILAGVALGVLGFLRLGFVSRFIPVAVQVGFMFGLGLTIIAGQLSKILGVPAGSGTFVEVLGDLVRVVSETNAWSLVLGAVALAVLVAVPRIRPTVPIALVVVVGGIVAVAVLGLADRGVEVIGLVEGAFPLPAIPAIEPGDLMALVPGAIAIAIVGSAEGLTVAQGFAQEHRYDIDADQELRAVGGSNIVAGLFQGFIVGGGASQSAAADRAGARTAMCSLLVAALTAATAAFLLPLFQDLPQPVLGAIVISAVIGFLRVGELRRIAALRRDSFAVALLALVMTLLLGILPGLIGAVILAIVLLLVRLARPHITLLDRDAGTDALVVRLEGPLLFLDAGALRDTVRDAVRAAPTPPTVVVLDLAMTHELDIESLDVLDRIAEQLADQGIELRLAGVQPLVRSVLDRGAHLGTRSFAIHATVADAIAAPGVDARSDRRV